VADVEVWHATRDRFLIRIRDHHLMVDQPVSDGGDDIGPTPTELFVAGLAACVGFYAERFLRRHGLPAHDVHVQANFELAKDRPARVASIDVALVVPCTLTTKQAESLQAMVEHCTVHNSLRQPPEVRIIVGTAVEQATQPVAVATGAA
jgi:putative redox protein